MDKKARTILEQKKELSDSSNQIISLLEKEEAKLDTIKKRLKLYDKSIDVSILSYLFIIIAGIAASIKFCIHPLDILVAIGATVGGAIVIDTIASAIVIDIIFKKYLIEGEDKNNAFDKEKTKEIEKNIQNNINIAKSKLSELENLSIKLEEILLESSNDINFLSQRQNIIDMKVAFLNPKLTKSAREKLKSKYFELSKKYKYRINELEKQEKQSSNRLDEMLKQEIINDILEIEETQAPDKHLVKSK